MSQTRQPLENARRSSAVPLDKSHLTHSHDLSTEGATLISNQTHEFQDRHIGPNEEGVLSMLQTLNFKNLEDMASQIIPQNIRSNHKFLLGEGVSENAWLQRLKLTLSENKVYKSMIGMGYSGTITPTVIQRNILENPVWYTAYTPYQAEIAQGRLEALLNFQTVVTDLTAMEIANASLLDEGTAAAEAMVMAHSIQKGKAEAFVVSPHMHPHVIEVLRTRAEPLGFKMIMQEPSDFNFSENVFAAFVQYPNTLGEILTNGKELAEKFHKNNALLIVGADLLALTLLTPPGEFGADIVYGNSQRFGVPLGFGGPHAAYLATKDAHKRLLAGRLVGVSIDSQGKRAYRLALQTREQHIRREKATSNICTAQVLLANMASMYAVYHGPQGLKRIATRVHFFTKTFAQALHGLGFQVQSKNYFDTIVVQAPNATEIYQRALEDRINLRFIDQKTLGLSFDETTDLTLMHKLLNVFKPNHGVMITDAVSKQKLELGALTRTSSYLQHPVFNSHHSETELLRYIHRLQNKDITLTHSMIPLGSCTMKLNATSELVPVSWPEINQMHPFTPLDQAKGYLNMIHDLEKQLCDITGFSGVSLQPNAGSQGEYAGLLVIRAYHQSRKEVHRNICLIPSSAHGTNPASAVMAGMKVVVVNCDDQGNVDVPDLKSKAEAHKNDLSALMITYPSTHGVFEESIKEICEIIHANGGQVYMDGANMNAIVGLCRPGEFGPDVMHMNLHKTFSIPHGGGGPGVGPIGVAKHLVPFLPGHQFLPDTDKSKSAVGATTSAPWGSASILPISHSYISMMGSEGLKRATLISILNANYIAHKLKDAFPVLYKGRNGFVAHECIIDLRGIKTACGIDVSDVAKRLIDYGFHSPTMSWPVPGTLMIEPTESESKEELDRFIEAMLSIREEIREVENKKVDAENNVLKNAPHTAQMVTADNWKYPYSREKAAYPLQWLRDNKFWAPVSRIDNAYGDRNIVCSCPPIEEYQS